MTYPNPNAYPVGSIERKNEQDRMNVMFSGWVRNIVARENRVMAADMALALEQLVTHVTTTNTLRSLDLARNVYGTAEYIASGAAYSTGSHGIPSCWGWDKA